jgi:hypothetical protein
MPGCILWVSADSAMLVAGAASLQVSYAIANNASLVGVMFYQQAWVPAAGANALGAVMSNACIGVIGP